MIKQYVEAINTLFGETILVPDEDDNSYFVPVDDYVLEFNCDQFVGADCSDNSIMSSELFFGGKTFDVESDEDLATAIRRTAVYKEMKRSTS